MTLNTNKTTSLGGLANLLPALPSLPSVILLQEVALHPNRVGPLAASLGYDAFIGTTLPQLPNRRLVSLVRRPLAAEAADPAPGYLQQLFIGDISFVNVHLPSHSDTVHRRRLVQTILQPLIATAAAPHPIIVGDFNCVFTPSDTEALFHQKVFPYLSRLLDYHSYADAFLQLHPTHPSPFTFHRRGSSASRLDRAYLPHHLANSAKIATHIATTSDHHAAFFNVAGSLAAPAAAATAVDCSETHWHLNSSILSDTAFAPHFAEFWAALLRSHPPEAATDAADWWELTAKPACRVFCQRFSKLLAHRRRETIFLHRLGLQQALAAGDWLAASDLRALLKEADAHRSRGALIRSRAPSIEGEEIDIFAAACEGRRPPRAALRIRTAWPSTPSQPASRILTAPPDIEREITNYFEALFQGRHAASAAAPEPADSGHTFVPDFTDFTAFTSNLRQLSHHQQSSLESPLQLLELLAAIEAAPTNKSPGLDGLPYEFYQATGHLIAPHLLACYTAALRRGRLPASMLGGAVRLLPKVPGVPAASQLRPITLLCTDYKLLTKILCQRLLPLLPSVLSPAQLCSVQGRSIFDGILALLSTAEELRRRREPGFLLNLDLFHAYDRVCLPFLDRVLAAMSFGFGFRSWIHTLHDGATATFLLHRHSPPIPITFSVRQGDPIAMLLFVIQIEPLLAALLAALPPVQVGDAMESVFAYVDDVDIVAQSEEALGIINDICSRFEKMSGAILNRNRKSAILGLGSWAGRQNWPLPWLNSPPTLRVFGVEFAATARATSSASWNAAIARFRAAIVPWQSRALTTLRQRRDVLETFLFSRLYYLAQAVPLPASAARSITAAAGAFLWGGSGFGAERVAWETLHNPMATGGLAVTDISSRAEALLVKQACWMAAQGGRPAAHLAFWHGSELQHLYPQLQPPPNPPRRLPDFLPSLAALLEEVAVTGVVDPASLMAATARGIYSDFMSTPPPPRIESKLPSVPWELAWPRVWQQGLQSSESDLLFRLLHNVLPVRARIGRLDPTRCDGTCPHCPGQQETLDHAFTTCIRVSDLWLGLFFIALPAHPAVPSNADLLPLAFPPAERDSDITATVATYISLVWSTRHQDLPPSWADFTAALRDRPPPFRPLWPLRPPL